MLIFPLLSFSNATIGNLESNIPLYVNHRQVILQGLWDLHVMKLNGKHVQFAHFENLHYTLCLTSKNGTERRKFTKHSIHGLFKE